MRASYEYKDEANEKKTKNYKGKDGRVTTDSWNVKTSPQSKIFYENIKKFKHSVDPIE